MNWTMNAVGGMLSLIYERHVRTAAANVMPFVHRR